MEDLKKFIEDFLNESFIDRTCTVTKVKENETNLFVKYDYSYKKSRISQSANVEISLWALLPWIYSKIK